jgi:hypothetical protein
MRLNVLRLRSIVLAAAAIAAFAGTAIAQEVDRVEMEPSQGERVVFVNYEGPPARVETRAAIRGIGYDLGKAVKAGQIAAGAKNRYYVVHAWDASQTALLSADVFSLGVDVGVDHIANLRLILQGYLEGAYDYSAVDAALLARFITVYNAVYRGRLDYFQRRYIPQAASILTADQAGLSVRFDEWPGRAQIVVPLLLARPGSLSAVDTTRLTEPAVVAELRTTGDQGVALRQEMVDLKEREAGQAAQEAALAREAIAQEELRIAAEKAALAADLARAAQPAAALVPPAAGPAQTAAAAQPAAPAAAQPVAAAQPATAAQPAAAATQPAAAPPELAARQADLAARETAVAQQAATAQAAEQLAAVKQAEAAADRADIAAGQNAAIAAEAAAPAPVQALAIGLRMNDPTSQFARLVAFDKANGKEVRSSALNTIRPRSVVAVGARIYAVAGEAGAVGAVRLVAIDAVSLERLGQSAEDAQSDTLIWPDADSLYAVVVVGGKPFLARFDADLGRRAISAQAVHPYAVPFFADGVLYAQAADGAPLRLDPLTLALKP